MTLRDLLVERIRRSGPLTVAEFMELALYHPEFGYYARAARRSGRAGDFFTSPDVGPVFGALVATQIADCWDRLGKPKRFDLVEAGAANGQLARDVLETLATTYPDCYGAVRLHLVERSAAARACQPATLGPYVARLATASAELPAQMEGVLIANELLDALPVHVVQQTDQGLREIYVDAAGDQLVERRGPLSTPALAAYFGRLGIRLEPGWRAEVNLAALEWIHRVASALQRGFAILIDYGHEAQDLYSSAHATGTLAAYRHHHRRDAADSAPGTPGGAPWLEAPGSQDLTAHVDFTSLGRVAEEAGFQVLGLVDQTYFLLALGAAEVASEDWPQAARPAPLATLIRRLAVKTLILPGGLGSTHKVLILAKGVGTPPLRGLSGRARRTP